MKISELLNNVSYREIVGSTEQEVLHVSQDTRDITEQGTLYCAIRGLHFDGHNLIPQAIERGASVIVCEQLPEVVESNVTYVSVDSTAEVLGFLASNFYDNPSKQMKIVGITGTNGKTTIAYTIYASLLDMGGAQPLLLSTAGDYFNGSEIEVNRKTSSSIEPVELQKTLAHYLKQGATHVCLEVTSHGLDQYRANGIDFNIGIFTNLTQDHLDYHKTMEHYAQSKKKLFDMLSEGAVAITNIDSEYGQYMVEDTKAQVVTYGTKSGADHVISQLQLSQEGQSFSLNDTRINTPLIGIFNAYNTTASYIALRELGYQEAVIVTTLAQIDAPKGRLEIIPNNKGICAVVDYAHTPDALENVLSTLKELPHKKIITVFGCGGDRDTTKRVPMAQIAEKLSDVVIVTSDNPRTEHPVNIINDIEKGFSQEFENYYLIESREEAIQKAVSLAEEDDIILVAGKGHEEYQIIGEKTISFSDQEVLGKYLS